MGLSAFIALAWLRMDLIMIELLTDDRTELGVYGAAQQPLEYLIIAGSIITTLSLPLMSRYYGKDPERYLPPTGARSRSASGLRPDRRHGLRRR